MEIIKVKKSELLDVLRANRTRHRSVVEAAMKTYRAEAIKQLDHMLADAKQGKRIRRTVTLIEPMDQTKDYDRVIRMIEMSVEEEIALSEKDFRMYVMDDWSWKAQFASSARGYLARSALADSLGEEE